MRHQYRPIRRPTLSTLFVGPALAVLLAACARTVPEQSQWLLSYDGSYKRSTTSDSFYVRSFSGPPGAECPKGLFNGVIFLGVQSAPSGRWYAAWANKEGPAHDATVEDWFNYLDTLAMARGAFARLNEAAMKFPARTVDIAVMLPAPVRDHNGPMRIASERVDIASDAGRRLYETYIDSLTRKFDRGQFGRLRLRAAYWLREEAWGDNEILVRGVADLVHSRGLNFLWIPYWGAGRATEWKTLGFDAAWQQPNYFFHSDLAQTRLDSAVSRARAADMGFELELDGRVFTDSSARRRLGEYVDVLKRNRPLSVAVYDGGGVLARLFSSSSPELSALGRRMSTALCR